MTTTDADLATTDRTWIVTASSIAFALLFVAGMLLAGGSNDTSGKTADQILKDFNDAKGGAIVGTFLLVVAGLAFLPVAWAAMRRVNAGLSLLGDHVARSTALLFVAMVFVSAGAFGALAGADVFGDEKNPSVDLVRFIPQLGFPIVLVAGALSAAAFLVVVSRAGQNASAVPSWFSVLGYLTAVAMLGGVFFLPMLMLPIWAVAGAYVHRQ
jgi:hypothetical protein